MKRKLSLLFSLIFLLMIPASARPQAWSGIIDPSRAIDWSNKGVNGGIPNVTTQCVTSACVTVTSNGSGSTLALRGETAQYVIGMVEVLVRVIGPTSKNSGYHW